MIIESTVTLVALALILVIIGWALKPFLTLVWDVLKLMIRRARNVPDEEEQEGYIEITWAPPGSSGGWKTRVVWDLTEEELVEWFTDVVDYLYNDNLEVDDDEE